MLTTMKTLLKKISSWIVEDREDFYDLDDLRMSKLSGIAIPRR